jgi:hypothetical protein
MAVLKRYFGKNMRKEIKLRKHNIVKPVLLHGAEMWVPTEGKRRIGEQLGTEHFVEEKQYQKIISTYTDQLTTKLLRQCGRTNGAYITKPIIILHQHPYELQK